MAKSNINIKISVESRDFAFDILTGLLRATGWQPKKEYGCGCKLDALCPEHARIRLAEHYR